MSQERRRYFRIDDTLKMSYEIVRLPDSRQANETPTAFDLVAEQDRRMEILIADLKNQYPELIELISLLNQKFERLAELEKPSHTMLNHPLREVNLSACGLAFIEPAAIAIGTHIRLSIILDSDEQLELEGLVVDCIPEDGESIWRVDFLSMNDAKQESLIQHVIKRQRAQLGSKYV